VFFPKLRPHRGQYATYVQAKRDGVAVRVDRTELGGLSVHTRRPTNITDSFYPGVFDFVGVGETLFGELWLPGSPASAVKSDLTACSFEAWGVVTNRLDLASPLHDVQSWCDSRVVPHCPWFTWESSDSPSVADLPPDVEGWVLKEGADWYKVKPAPTVDCVVTGVTGGVGKYAGLVGCLHVGVYKDSRSDYSVLCDFITAERDRGPDMQLVEVARVSGMDDEQRAEMTRTSPIGRVCEVAYQYVGSRGRLRHPRFIRWRDDKSAQECTHDQIERRS